MGKAQIIQRIKEMLQPKHKLAAYYIQEGTGKFFQYKGRLLTLEECRQIPAGKRKRFFIVPATPRSQIMKLGETKIYF